METRIEAYTIADFLKAYGIGQTKFGELVKSGELRVRRVGRRVLVPREAAEEWFNSLPEDKPHNMRAA